MAHRELFLLAGADGRSTASRFRHLLAAMVAVLVGTACTKADMHRTTVAPWDVARCDSARPETLPEECKTHSIERHVLPGGGEYHLGVVEFDDQGWFHHAGQMERLLSQLEEAGRDRDLIVSVFVHGWKHGAEYCDDNLSCYRSMLEQLVRAEERYTKAPEKRRPVFGVYVGWRGLSIEGPDVIRSLSFWDRKNTATQVALGSVRELLGRLRELHESRNAPASAKSAKDRQASGRARRNRLFITGHSFGGLMVYNSVAQYLMNSAIVGEGKQETEEVKGFGDLVVLINPAFEAARYEPLHHIAQTRRYKPHQDPVFISITSRDDSATRSLFPAGRWLSTRFEKYTSSPSSIPVTIGKDQTHTRAQQREANLHTMGHIDHYVSHRLSPTRPGELAADPPQDESRPCTCSYARGLALAANVDWDTETRASEEFARRFKPDGRLVRGWKRDFLGGISLVHLTREEGADPSRQESPPDSPFWVVQTDAPIVTGHNQFWTSHLLNVLRQVYDDILRKDGTPGTPGK